MKKAAFFGVVLLGSALAFGCDSLDSLLGPGEMVDADVQVLQRLDALSTDVSATASIGATGGTIELPGAGLRVVVPGNAVVLPAGAAHVEITVTAVQGKDVAYLFEPHGLQFRTPLIVHQDARVTEAKANSNLRRARGAYFSDRARLNGIGGARVSEFRPTEFNPGGNAFRWSVDHFSGYLLAIG